MKLRTLTWNIGGGKLLEPGKDPRVMSSYTKEGLTSIVAKLKDIDADIIMLQEVQSFADTNQIATIAKRMGLQYFFYDPTSKSHIDDGQSLGNGIISKYPISEHKTGLFYNPKVTFSFDGDAVQSHDKGYGHCLIDFNGYKIRAITLHLLPFQKVGIDIYSKAAKKIFKSVAAGLTFNDEHILLQGDFNIDASTIGRHFNTLVGDNELLELPLKHPTTPRGHTLDHVLYKGMTVDDVIIDSSVKTDHYPVICTFQI